MVIKSITLIWKYLQNKTNMLYIKSREIYLGGISCVENDKFIYSRQ